MDMKEAELRLELARKRTEEIHRKIGTFSSYFAELELQLFEMLTKFLNPSDPKRLGIVISQHSFRQCKNTLKKYVLEYFNDKEIQEEIKNIDNKLDSIATERNEIIHSSWLAYSTGDFGQHRARAKGGKPAGLHELKENPEEKVNKLIKEIDEVLFDLICFEDKIIEDDSEQSL
jgi:flagellar biosynthesis chaperone FliJ